MAKKQFDWNSIELSNEIFLSENKTVRIKFLDNEVDSDTVDINGKETDKYSFNVLNLLNKTERTLGIISNPLMNELKLYQPLQNKEFSIRKYRSGATEFDIEYEVIHLNPIID